MLHRLMPVDVGLLRKLNALFGDAFADPETYGAEPPSDAYLESLLAKEHVVALVALKGEDVLSGLVACELASPRGHAASCISMTSPYVQNIDGRVSRQP
jgi:aminoglycoside 3-N-acetyltransferase I